MQLCWRPVYPSSADEPSIIRGEVVSEARVPASVTVFTMGSLIGIAAVVAKSASRGQLGGTNLAYIGKHPTQAGSRACNASPLRREKMPDALTTWR